MSDRVLIVDGANVVGSRPDGWWRDRAGAAARLQARLLSAGLDYDTVVLVLEGQARAGVAAGRDQNVETVHADADGDTTIARLAREALASDAACEVVTADRALAARVEGSAARVRGPNWLLELLGA